MPPKVRFQQHNIVDAAFELARNHGLEAINARSVASEIGCSTQPLFRVFENMDQLKACVLEKAEQCFDAYINNTRKSQETSYKFVGMAYLLFAMNEPHLFQMVFLRCCDNTAAKKKYGCSDHVIDTLVDKSGFNREQAQIIQRHMWIYTYGLAALLMTKQLCYDEAELSRMIDMEYRAIVSGLLWKDADQICVPS